MRNQWEVSEMPPKCQGISDRIMRAESSEMIVLETLKSLLIVSQNTLGTWNLGLRVIPLDANR